MINLAVFNHNFLFNWRKLPSFHIKIYSDLCLCKYMYNYSSLVKHYQNNFKIKCHNCRKRENNTFHTQIQERSLSWLGINTSNNKKWRGWTSFMGSNLPKYFKYLILQEIYINMYLFVNNNYLLFCILI
jgi:hypothetical protein